MPEIDRPDLPVVLLSHRSPVSFGRDGDDRTVTRGAGGLVTALMSLATQLEDSVWVCAAASDEDRAVTAEYAGRAIPVELFPEPRLAAEDADPAGVAAVRMVEVDPERHELFYGVISNPLLWFVQHGLYGRATEPDLTQAEHEAFDRGYVAVNEQFADAVSEEVERLGGRALVMLHDYHFYLVAERVRRRCSGVTMSHFVHIPWPGPNEWTVLPPRMRDPLFRGLLGNDVVAFHTERFARNFLLCMQELLGLPVDWQRLTVEVDGRKVAARFYAISIEADGLRKYARSEEVTQHKQELRETYLKDGCELMVRVDRTDPSKNIVRGFRAFSRMLDVHPELKGRVTFLAMLQPSRQDVQQYADYIAAIGAAVAEANARHATPGWQPVELRMENNFAFAVAVYALCDVLVVNALADGMNLVAKEAVVVNERAGVLALSENTGAYQELGEYAVRLYPFDIEQQAEAMYEALTMPSAERSRRLARAAEVVRNSDIDKWLADQLDDLAVARRKRVPPVG